ncbi:MAG: hypothetical protein FWH26_11485, partial [Oscillospiraceae bacterium]|nr:hypothetical protein [Oscillospiraceae bacterium]
MKRHIFIGLLAAALALGLAAGCSSDSGDDHAETYEPLIIKGRAEGRDVEIEISTDRTVAQQVLTPTTGDSYAIRVGGAEVSRGTVSVSGQYMTFIPSDGSPSFYGAWQGGSNLRIPEIPMPGTEPAIKGFVADGFGGGGGGGSTVGTFSGSGNTIGWGLILGVREPPYEATGALTTRAPAQEQAIRTANEDVFGVTTEWTVASAAWTGLRNAANRFERGDEPVLTVSLNARSGYVFVNGQLPPFELDGVDKANYEAQAPYMSSSMITVTFRFRQIPRLQVTDLDIAGILAPAAGSPVQPAQNIIAANSGAGRQWSVTAAQWNVTGNFVLGTAPILDLRLEADPDYYFQDSIFDPAPEGQPYRPFTLTNVDIPYQNRPMPPHSDRAVNLQVTFEEVHAAQVRRAPGSQGTEGDGKIINLTAAGRYVVRQGDTWYGVTPGGTLGTAVATPNEAAGYNPTANSFNLLDPLTGTEITSLTNGLTYDVYLVGVLANAQGVGRDGIVKPNGRNALARITTTDGQTAHILEGAGSAENDTTIVLFWDEKYPLRATLTSAELADGMTIAAGGGLSTYGGDKVAQTSNTASRARIAGAAGTSYATVSGVGEFTKADFAFTGRPGLGPGSQGDANLAGTITLPGSGLYV